MTCRAPRADHSDQNADAAYIATDSWAYSNSSARNVTCKPAISALQAEPEQNTANPAHAVDSPDTKGNFTASFDSGSGGSLLYVPSSSGDVGFTNSTSSSSQITTGFGFYGHVIYVTINGTMITQWGAVPTIDSSLWKLVWNSGDDGVFPIALRNIAPS